MKTVFRRFSLILLLLSLNLTLIVHRIVWRNWEDLSNSLITLDHIHLLGRSLSLRPCLHLSIGSCLINSYSRISVQKILDIASLGLGLAESCLWLILLLSWRNQRRELLHYHIPRVNLLLGRSSWNLHGLDLRIYPRRGSVWEIWHGCRLLILEVLVGDQEGLRGNTLMRSSKGRCIFGKALSCKTLSLVSLAVLDMNRPEHFIDILNLEEAHVILSISNNCCIIENSLSLVLSGSSIRWLPRQDTYWLNGGESWVKNFSHII